MALNIGNVKLNNPFILAPLAGITDAPSRLLASEMGAAMVYSEMVSCKGLYYRDKNTGRLLDVLPGEAPVAYQLFGSEPEMLEFATRTLVKAAECDTDAGTEKDEHSNRCLSGIRIRNVSFDINMGCPVPKVVKNGEGSALMKDPGLAAELVAAAVSGAGGKPVTVKMRKGFDENTINAIQMAQKLSAAGAAAIAVHGRTREQYYSGKADWDIIRAVREAVDIPIIANGDVFSGADALAIMAHTGCDMVMIARGALGNPWIFTDAKYLWETMGRPDGAALLAMGEEKVRAACAEIGSKKVSREEKIGVMLRHLDLSLDFKGEYSAVREMRKHVGWYLKGEHGAASLRRGVNEITDAEELRRAIEFLRE